MPINVRCTECGKTLAVQDQMAGRRGKCPTCGAVIVIPAAGAVQRPPSGMPRPAAPPQAVARAPQPRAARPSRVPQPTPYAAAPVPPMAAGSVTPPETFAKLWKWHLYGMFGSLGMFLLAGCLLFGTILAMITSLGMSSEQRFSRIGNAIPGKTPDPNFPKDFPDFNSRPQMTPAMASPPPSFPWYVFLAIPILLLGWLLNLAGGIAGIILLYKEWALIQDGEARTTPLKAVLFLLIPFFSIYWVFVAFYGLAQDLNKYARERQIPAREAPEGLTLAALIVLLVGSTVAVGPLVGIVLALIAANGIKNTCMDIAKAKLGVA